MLGFLFFIYFYFFVDLIQVISTIASQQEGSNLHWVLSEVFCIPVHLWVLFYHSPKNNLLA